jgi:signal transduction histidine kinase
VLSFARKSDSEPVPQNLVDLLEQTVTIAGSDYDLKKKFDFRHIEIVREYENELPAVLCDPSMIQQVILNLLRNAAEAMQEDNAKEDAQKPRITLRLASEQEANLVRIEVEDNGSGLDEATRKRVFEPFFTTKPPGEGTGLGLSVSYFIITEHHGGRMRVESTLGNGANFIIKLPVHPTP